MKLFMRLATMTYLPYQKIVKENGTNIRLEGIYGKLLDVMSTSMNFSYTIIDAGSWGVKVDGSWNGAMGMLHRDEADIALSCHRPSESKLEVGPLSPVTHPVEVAILAGRKTRFYKDAFAILKDLSLEIWIILTFGILLISILLSLWHPLLDDSKKFKNLLGKYSMLIYGYAVRECATEPPRFNSLRLLCMSWILGVSVILMNTYAGQLKSAMLFRPEMPRIRGMLDVYRKSYMRAYLPRNSIEPLLKTSDKHYMRKMYTRIVHEQKTNLPGSVLISSQTLNSVHAGKSVLIMSRPALAAVAESHCVTMSSGDLYTAREPVVGFLGVLIYNRRLQPSIQTRLNNTLEYLSQAGLIDLWYRGIAGTWKGCLAASAKHGHQLEALHLTDLEGLFYITLIGHAAAILAFLGEFYCTRAVWKKFMISNHIYQKRKLVDTSV